MMQAVILAAGKGKRLHPLTLTRSKGLLPIAGKPMITRILEGLPPCGISEVILVASPEDNNLQEYYELNPVQDVSIQIVYQHQPQGMANALSCASPLLHEDFLLSACDNLIPHFYMREMCIFWRKERNFEALLALMRITHDQAASSSVVQLNGYLIERIIEKPLPHQIISLVSSIPFYIFTPRILDLLPNINLSSRGEYELQDAIQGLITIPSHVRGFMVPVRDNLTTVDDFLNMNLRYLEDEAPQYVHPSNRIHPGIKLIPPYFIEHDVIIEDGASVGPCVYIGYGSRILARASIAKSVILDRAVVEPDTVAIKKVVHSDISN
jgi:dTDP-glucose pyrophosphorylase